jgi:lipase
VQLHLHEWGDPAAPPLVCVHGISAHGARFRRLAEERLSGFRVVAPDLRGHGRSGWEPPWALAQMVDDVLETVAAAGIERAPWIGHSYGGRVLLEIAALRPDLVERAVLLDPAITILPNIGLDFAELQRADLTYESPEEAVARRLTSDITRNPEVLEEELREHLVRLASGRYTYRFCPSTAVVMYSDICSAPPPPETLRAPTLLVYAPDFGLVRRRHLDAYRDRAEIVAVPGGHIVYWDAFDETADAVTRFLA